MEKLRGTFATIRKKYTYHHFSVFVLTFFSYSLLHVTRKSFSNVKDVMQMSWTPTNHTKYPGVYPPHIWDSQCFFDHQGDAELFLGYLDTTFLFCYAIGLYCSGIIGDRFNLRYVLCIGMVLSSLMVFMFGSLGPWLNVYSVYYYGVFWGLNGLVQSTGWPSVVAIMGNWFGKASHGAVFGIWSANASMGNIFGALLVAGLLPYGFPFAMMAASFLLFLGAVVIFFCLVEHPSVVGLPSAQECDNRPKKQQRQQTVQAEDETKPLLNSEGSEYGIGEDSVKTDHLQHHHASSSAPHKKGKAINFFRAFLIPGVVVYSLSYACLKLVNYCLFFWLPYYLNNRYDWASPEEADRLSTLYDVGGIVGGAVGGFISDRLGKRSPVVVVMLLLAVGVLFAYQGFGTTPLTNGILMTVAGVFIGGPANLESSAITADLGKQSSLKDNSEALATVTGIVDGTGSVGAAIGQTLLPLIQDKTGQWKFVFYFLMAMLAGSAIFLVDLFVRDMWDLIKSAHRRIKSWRTHS